MAQAVVNMSVEAANQSFVVEVFGLMSKQATTKGDAKFTTNIISTADVKSKGIKQGFDSCKRIFGTVKNKLLQRNERERKWLTAHHFVPCQ